MIELPESKNLSDRFLEFLKGKTVINVKTNTSPHKFAWFHGDPLNYHNQLAGKSVTGSASYGGMAELQIENKKLVFCDGTNVRYFRAGTKLPEKHQLHVEFDDSSSLICSVQMYGAMWLIENDGDEGYYYSSKHKVKPFDDKFDKNYFYGLMDNCKPNLSVKAFLATEQRIPGLGNGVLQDILFNAKLHPKRKLMTLSEPEKETMYNSVKQTLFDMTFKGGRDTEKDMFGAPGGYKTILSAKTKDKPCPVCGGDTRREAYMGGNVYFCPVCQKL